MSLNLRTKIRSVLSGSAAAKTPIRFSAIIFLVCLLFTFLLWDHFLNSEDTIDQRVASHLILLMGSLFSGAAGLFTLSLEIRRSDLEKEVERRIRQIQKRDQAIQQADEEIKVLRSIIPICASCKRIRDDKGLWQQIENYVEQHSEAKFSHGICSDCRQKLYPNIKRPAN